MNVDQVRNIFLVGFMASGKTSVGIALTRLSGWPFIDTDDEVVRWAGKSIDMIFQGSGEDGFRELEQSVINTICQRDGRIIAAGGGAFVDQTNRSRMLESGEVFCLDASANTILGRLSSQTGNEPVRPLLAGEDPLGRVQELMAERQPAYSEAHHTIRTDKLTPDEIASLILLTCGLEPRVSGG
jgi:shikimate kinase